MINIYTNTERLPRGVDFENDSTFYFDQMVLKLTNEEIDILKPVDNFKYLGGNAIETPYGICSIYELSTGSKTIINVLRNPDKIFDVTGCGSNALEVLFRLIKDRNLSVVLDHVDFDLENEDIFFRVNCRSEIYNVNNIAYAILEEEVPNDLDRYI